MAHTHVYISRLHSALLEARSETPSAFDVHLHFGLLVVLFEQAQQTTLSTHTESSEFTYEWHT